MKQIAGYVADYFRHIHKFNFVIITLILSVLVFINYYFGLNNFLSADTSFSCKSLRYYWLFGLVFIVTWLLSFIIADKRFPRSSSFYLLLILSPAVFAVKVSLQVNDLTELTSSYLNTVLVWPVKSLVTLAAVLILWYGTNNRNPPAGLGAKNFHASPYFILLLLMVPLLLIAGRGADFQNIYPKLQLVHEQLTPFKKLFFELCYGLDFFTIELFFRGFLILAFIKYAGVDAILPMAAFYCTIHFGKPVAECISSYFGGLILGAVVYSTRSIWGGLIVHLGIAWMMEVVGVLKF